jgi:HIT zinc finger
MQISSLRPTNQVVVLDSLHSAAISTSNVDEVGAQQTTAVPCAICHERESLYSCPRCRIPYCSVSCYQKHDEEVVNTDEILGNSGGRRCTEQFYENRVSQVLRLEVKENSKLVRHRLRDALSNQLNDEPNGPLDVSDPESCDRNNLVESNCLPDQLDRRELLELLSILEKVDETGNRGDCISNDEVMILNEQLKQNCSIKVQTLVHEAMKHFANDTSNDRKKLLGNVIEWILEPWKPWWRADVQPFIRDGSSDTDSIEDDDGEVQSHDEQDMIRTIDERILALPQFETLFRMKQCIDDASNLDQVPKLQYNLVDILLGTVFTLRLHCGVNNIKNQNLAVDAATTLVSASNVLLNDVRHTSLESVLVDCSSTNHPTQKLLCLDHLFLTNQSMAIGSCNQNCLNSNTVIFQDVAMLFQNFRLVVRALFEANDIVKAAILEIRLSVKSSRSENATILTEQRNQLLHVHKKIQFYLSWCVAIRKLCHGAWPLTRMSSDIILWLDAWRIPTNDRDIR